jgi:class 3 adenylate cyclase
MIRRRLLHRQPHARLNILEGDPPPGIQCASPLKRACQKCGFENPQEAKFCAQCAASLEATQAMRTETGPRDGGLTGERRHLTVLFCDLVASTTIAAQLDPEEWREIVAGYQRAAADAINPFRRPRSEISRRRGHGLFQLAPGPRQRRRAGGTRRPRDPRRDREAQRTICACKLSARIGIDSGTVVVGAGAGKDADVFGDAPNIAARVQAAAEPGTIVITDATHRLVWGLFVVEDRGAPALKGIEREIRLYRVIRPSGMRGRFEAAAAAGGLTPFVGREEELNLLLNRWERAREGDGQVVTIVGEAGIGKSRLLQRFHEQIAETAHTWIEAGAGAFFQNTPFHPVSELLRQVLGDAPGPSQEPFAQFESRLAAAGLEPAEAIPLLRVSEISCS